MEDPKLDITKLKYVLYVRKSTKDSKNQVRSINDQITECKQYANNLNIHIVGDPIIENESAKTPGIRPLFLQMLKEIKTKKYDGIISWHPDRLARNMKEGGEVIGMLDDGTIKDLKFVTHYFSNDPTGKMLLGISFVLSKLYSDNLSVNVTRGIKGNSNDGIFSAPKHGYVKDGETRFDIPDKHNNNFKLICEAWDMRKKGDSYESIAEHINAKGYGRIVKSSGKEIKLTKQILNKSVFNNPFFYGVVVQANQKTDLREIYNFEPAVSEEDFFAIQRISSGRIKPYTKKKRANFNPFRQFIECSYCKKHMWVAPSPGNKYQYLYARCDNKLCIRNSKENKDKDRSDPTKIKASVRTKVVLDFIYDFLDKGLNFTEQDYKQYLENFKQLSERQKTEITQEIHVKMGLLSRVKNEINTLSLKYMKLDNSKKTIKKVTEEKIAELEGDQLKLESSIEKLKNKISNPEEEQLTIEEFLNLSKNAGTVVKSANAVMKDKICRFIFLNLSINDKKVVSYRLKEPFKTLVENRLVALGELERTRTSDLFDVNEAL